MSDLDSSLASIRENIDASFSPKKAIDFGCGVGRILIPLAKLCDEVTGIDVSKSMLDEARRNCDAYLLQNVTLVRSDDSLSDLSGSFDFVHSLIVFQHIPQDRAVAIFEQLLGHLDVGGVGVVHFVYGQRVVEAASRPTAAFGITERLRDTSAWRLARRGLRRDPEMQMNMIDLNSVFAVAHAAGVRSLHVEFRDHGEHLAATLFFRAVEKAS